MSEQCFCLRWNNYQSNVVGDLRTLLESEEFLDVTLACEGRRLKAHRLMLSACSNYFRNLLRENPTEHPIIFLRDVRFWELESIMDFIYNGQVNVMQDQLPGFIRTAESLQIKGLAAVNNNNNSNNNNIQPPKMYELKHIHEMLMRQPEGWKDGYPNKSRPNSSSPLTTSDSYNNNTKLLPPLVHPAKRFRPDNGAIYPNPASLNPDDLPSRYSPNSLPYINRSASVFKKESSPPPLLDSSDTHEFIKKEIASRVPDNLSTVDSVLQTQLQSESLNALRISTPPPISSPYTKLSSPGLNKEEGVIFNERLLSSPLSDKDKEKKMTDINGSSRSGSPEDEARENEEDHSSHDGSIASMDGLKEGDWSSSDPSNSPMSISVNEAGLPICKVCGKVFKHQGSLVAHYQVHQQRTKCPVCKKVLSRHYHMKVHLLTVHKVPDSEIEGLLRSQNIT